MLTWNFTKKLFNGFMIQRWTDFIRPCEYVQLEKSATQAILSYLIGKEYEANANKNLDWEYIIDNSIYGLLCKIATSDIKATISKQIKKEHLDDFINYIMGVYCDNNNASKYSVEINATKISDYLGENNKTLIENQICYIAHKFSTYFEFKSIERFNTNSPDIERVRQDLNPTTIINEVSDVVLQKIALSLSVKTEDIYIIFAYFEKLRPQIRWSQTCRIPQTTVLGHSMYVAALTYFVIKDLKIENDENKYLVDSFYCALFHDLPESLTRDIISPVKNSINNFNEMLAAYEYTEVSSKIVARIKKEENIKHFLYLLGKTDTTPASFKYEINRGNILGSLIKGMDMLAAFMEAKMSVLLGVNSEEIQKGIKTTSNYLRDVKDVIPENVSCQNIDFSKFLSSIPQHTQGV